MEPEITNNVLMLVAKSTAVFSYIMIKSGLYRFIHTRMHAHTHTYFVTVYPRSTANSKQKY
jgi:hypothetical protein